MSFPLCIIITSCNCFRLWQNAEGEVQKDLSGESSDALKERDEKKPKIEQNTGSNLRGKQTSKQAKDTSSGDASKDNYIHVRARRGQATNSHSLAERVPSYHQCLIILRKVLALLFA